MGALEQAAREGLAAARARVDADRLGAVVHVSAESTAGDGPLAGVPFLVKDVMDVAGEVTRCGSRTTEDDPPATEDAEVVRRLRAAGAVVVGRTRTHEHAWGLTTQHAVLGGTSLPQDPSRVPGGSSGGSAAAVASGLVPVALGTDTACSLRLPAAWCGVVAHKPTHGLVPATGVSPLAPSLDHVGALTRDVADTRTVLEVMAGRPMPVRRTTPAGLRVGVLRGDDLPMASDVRAVVDATLAALADAGAELVDLASPSAAEQWDCFVAVQAAEALAEHRSRGWWPAKRDLYGGDVRGRLQRAEVVTAEDVARAHVTRAGLRAWLAGVLDRGAGGVDVLLGPVAGSGPARRDDPDHVLVDGRVEDLRAMVLPHTVLADLCGSPACAVPAGLDVDGLPVGLQVTGPVGADPLVLDVAELVEALRREDVQP